MVVEQMGDGAGANLRIALCRVVLAIEWRSQPELELYLPDLGSFTILCQRLPCRAGCSARQGVVSHAVSPTIIPPLGRADRCWGLHPDAAAAAAVCSRVTARSRVRRGEAGASVHSAL